MKIYIDKHKGKFYAWSEGNEILMWSKTKKVLLCFLVEDYPNAIIVDK